MPVNVEKELVAHLAQRLGVPAYAEVPDPRPPVFVTVERTGGPTEPARDLPSLAVQFWAQSRYEASELCRAGVRAIAAFSDVDGVFRVEVTGSYSFPDPESGQSRYQATCEAVTSPADDADAPTYGALPDKPSIEGHVLVGESSLSDIGIAGASREDIDGLFN